MSDNKYKYSSPLPEERKSTSATIESYSSPGTAAGDVSGNSDEKTLKDLILTIQDWSRFLLSQWLILGIAIIIGAILGLTYSLYKSPIYEATTTFVLEDNGGGGGLGQYAGLASMVGIDMGGGSSDGIFSGDNIIQLYKSRSMLAKTLLSTADFGGKQQLLIDRYINFNKLKQKWDNPELLNIEFKLKPGKKYSRLQDSLLGEVIKDINKFNLVVGKPDKKLTVIRVEVKSKDEDFAKAFNEKIVSTVNDFFIQTKTKKALANVAILQHQADSVKAVMTGAIFASASTLDGTPNLNPTRQILRAPVQRSQFNAEANKAILTELVKNLELSKMNLRKETPLIQVIDVPVLPLEKERVGKAKGIVLGAISGGFLVFIILIVRRFLKMVLAK